MRVIAGSAGGRRLRSPRGRRTRPTPDRVREALFNSLAARVPGARALDLYAGSGALGIEALSRGAEHAVLVDDDPGAVAAVRDNLRSTGLAARATVIRADASRFARAPRQGPFDLVFVDPPYDRPIAAVYALLAALREAGGLADGATVVVERSRRDPGLEAEPPRFLACRRRRSYGDTVLIHLEATVGDP